MHGSVQEHIQSVSGFLAGYYVLLAGMNAVMAFYLWHQKHRVLAALFWAGLAVALTVLASTAGSGFPPEFPAGFREAVDQSTGPVVYSMGTTAALVVAFVFRKFFCQPLVAWSVLMVSLVAMGMAIPNPVFASIVMKPDNVPIVGMVFLLGYFTWLGAAKAVKNDERLARGEPPLEKLDDEKVLVWPDLVYVELICMIALTVVLVVWGVCLQAPLEEPASLVKTPNPSKAPWYFLGLQEMLVYYDPWFAGVVAPSLIIFGLMAIPFLDFNKKGNGYYTINERKFAYLTFQFGFLVLWVTLIILGTFLRGPNWNFFGPFENWDVHKVVALSNVDLSEYFWIHLWGRALPRAPVGSGFGTELGFIIWRELPGLLLLGFYFFFLPPLMAVTIFRKFFVKMGFIRYMIMANLLLFMAALPIKMVLRWTLNLKYLVHIDEYFLNF